MLRKHHSIPCIFSNQTCSVSLLSALDAANDDAFDERFLNKRIHDHDRDNSHNCDCHTDADARKCTHFNIDALQLRCGFEELNVVKHIRQNVLNTVQIRTFYKVVQTVRPVVPVSQTGHQTDRSDDWC